MIPEFVTLLKRMEEIHAKKNEDYATKGQDFENFERSAAVAAWFHSPTDKAFMVLIGTKMARLATLLNKRGKPNNESIDDSFLDLCTYCALWASFHARGNDGQL